LFAERSLHPWRLAQLLVPEDGVQAIDPGVDVALPAGLEQQPAQLCLGQLRRQRRRWCGTQDRAGVGAGEPGFRPGENHHRGGKVLAQQGPKLIGDLLAVPRRVLPGAGQHRDRLGQLGVGRQAPVNRHIGAQNVGQHQRVGVVGLRSRDCVSLAIPRDRQRVDRIHRPASGAQAGHQQATAGLDRHRDRILRRVTMVDQQLKQ
jgi:hypothetical protein